jgi:hypothetical protein
VRAAGDELVTDSSSVLTFATNGCATPATSAIFRSDHLLGKRRIRRGKGTAFAELSILEASEQILLDGKPRTPIEIVIELQNRGYDTGDNPRRIVRSIKAAFQYHPDRVKWDVEGRWFVATQTA